MKVKDKVVYVLCYGLAAAALTFYLVTLYRGLHPNPSAGYQAYYLEQELYTWPGHEGIRIVEGQDIHFDSETGSAGQGAGHIMRLAGVPWNTPDGWSYVEGKGYCIVGWRCRLLFEGNASTAYHVSMTLSAPKPGGEVTVFVNQEQVCFSEFPEMEQMIEFDTPPLPEDGRLEMEIVLGGDMETPVSVKELIFT